MADSERASSTRSSRRSSRPNIWRSLDISRKAAPVSVTSLVFGEREQGAPLMSALEVSDAAVRRRGASVGARSVSTSVYSGQGDEEGMTASAMTVTPERYRASVEEPPASPVQIPTQAPESVPQSATSLVSVDESVPPLVSTPKTGPTTALPPALLLAATALKADDGEGRDSNERQRIESLSSLNPSTSRFSLLSLPLLGRRKPATGNENITGLPASFDPLPANAPEGVPRDYPSLLADTPTHTPTDTLPPPSSERMKSTSEPDLIHPEPSTNSSTSTVDTSSWWTYIPWSTSSFAVPVNSTSDPAPTLPDPDPAFEPTLGDSGSLRPGEDIRQTGNEAEAGDDDRATPTPTPKRTKEGVPASEDGENQDAKQSSGGTASGSDAGANGGGPVWYAPWSWGGTPVRGTAEEGGEVENRKEEASMEVNAEEGAESLVRADEEREASEGASPPSIPDPNPSANPVESTLRTNAGGWMEFFASRALYARRIGPSSSSSSTGMEIMDIDGEGEGALPVPFDGAASKESKNAKSDRPVLALGTTTTDSDRISVKSVNIPPLTSTSSAGASRFSKSAAASTSTSGTSTPFGVGTGKVPIEKKVPNLVLPTWAETFDRPPRNAVSRAASPAAAKRAGTGTVMSRAVGLVREVLWGVGGDEAREGVEGEHGAGISAFGRGLPRAYEVVRRAGSRSSPGETGESCRRVVVIGIHGWFPGAVVRTVLGEPTGTSTKFVNMTVQALEAFQAAHNVQFERITRIPLEGEGTIEGRVDKLFGNLLANKAWVAELHEADAVLIATHSQGSVVSTHLLDRLYRAGILRPAGINRSAANDANDLSSAGIPVSGASPVASRPPQRVCCLALCGIHLGPLRYLRNSVLLHPYLTYFESTAAKELFEFQDTESVVSRAYVKALRNVLNNGTKMVYVASLNDQVVPLYSGLFTAASHPLILRALYIDGEAYHTSDFLSNLLVLLLRVLNAGLSDSGLLAHLSEATAGSLNGVGHSTAYEELATYTLAVDYLFLTDSGIETHSPLAVQSFSAAEEQNDYEIPWALRDVVADERVKHFFAREILLLRDAFRDWHPKTTILRDIKRKLQPIQRLPPSFSTSAQSGSKL